MIKQESVERALHSWEPWVKAVEDGRRCLVPDATAEVCWAYASIVLKNLRLPTKAALRVYFLSCVFSSYKQGEHFVFGEIRLPPSEKLITRWPPYRVEANSWHPLPPAILTKKDIQRLLNDCRHFRILNMSPSEAIRKYHAPYFMVLDQQHPVRQIGSKMKRCMNPDIAIACVRMHESMRYEEINRRFGWRAQKSAYCTRDDLTGAGIKRNRFPTVRRYVRLGRKLISDSCEKHNRNFPEFLADSAEQIAESMDKTGLRDKIDQAFAAAIARARGRPRRSCQPAIKEAKEVDSRDDTSPK